jgi:hypothetical protein
MVKQSKRRVSKIRPVPIAQMRVPPAMVTQRRFIKAHGDSLAADLDLDKLGFPIMNHRDGIYWVLDGQHRIYALKECGFGKDNLDCEVYDGLTDAEMADIFLGRDTRKPVNVFTKFHLACTAGHSRELEIQRMVEANHLKIAQQSEENCIGAVSSLGKVFDRSGPVVLGQVLRSLRDGFASDPAAFDGQLIEGMGLVFNRYNGRTNEKEMAERLAHTQHGVRGLMRRVETFREKTGSQKAVCVAAAVVEIYNKSARGKQRLPSWWKDSE